MTAKEKLTRIADILGVDTPRDARLNLNGAMIDLHKAQVKPDAAAMRTLYRVYVQLRAAQDVLEMTDA